MLIMRVLWLLAGPDLGVGPLMLMMRVLWALAGPDLGLVGAADAHDARSLGSSCHSSLPGRGC